MFSGMLAEWLLRLLMMFFLPCGLVNVFFFQVLNFCVEHGMVEAGYMLVVKTLAIGHNNK